MNGNILETIRQSISFDDDKNISKIFVDIPKRDTYCFLQKDIYFRRNWEKIVSDCTLPAHWTIITLNARRTYMCKKSNFFRVKHLDSLLGFVVRRSALEYFIKHVNESKSLLDIINDHLDKYICYGYYHSIILDTKQSENDLQYYSYYDPENLFVQTKQYFKTFVKEKNISVRHLFWEMPKHFKKNKLIEVFDFILGCAPKFINELLSIVSHLNVPMVDIEKYFDEYHNYKNKSSNEFVNKDIMNMFFDKFIYEQPAICAVVPSFNNSKWCKKNLDSIFNQDYANFRVIYIDDQSTDDTYTQVTEYRKKYPYKLNLLRQSEHNAQCCGRFIAYHSADNDEIICNVDGDDWLYDREDIHCMRAFHYVSQSYLKGNWSSYGCFYKSSGPQWMETKTLYPSTVIEEKQYRNYKFLCKHLRTGYAGLYKNIKLDDLMGPDNRFLHMCTDIAAQYPVLEMAGVKHENVLVPTYVYNQDNSVQYANSWYNLQEETNQKNKIYHDAVHHKLKNTKPYETIDNFNELHNICNFFNCDVDTFDIVIHTDNAVINSYINSKIEHELKHKYNYKIHHITDIDQFKPTCDLILYLRIDNSKQLVVNLALEKHLHWMNATHLEFILLDNTLINCDNQIILSTDDVGYTVSLQKTQFIIEHSGFYTRDRFLQMRSHQLTGWYLLTRPKEIVTYIVALYNIPPDWVAACLDSLSKQSCPDFRIVVCEDQTPNLDYRRIIYPILHKYQIDYFGNKLRIVSNRKNLGLSGTNRSLVGHVETSIIACLDPDDAVHPDTTAELLKAYSSSELYDFVYSNFYYCDANLQIKSKGFSRELSKEKLVFEENCISHIRTYRKCSYHQTLGYDRTFRSAEDKDIILKFEETNAKFCYIPKELYYYRHNANSLSKEGTDAFNNQKTLQYCKTAVINSYLRRQLSGQKIPQISLDKIWARYGMKGIDETSYENYFDNFFDQIYVINLQKNQTNYHHMAVKLQAIGAKKVTFLRFEMAGKITHLVEAFSAINGSPIQTTFEKREGKKMMQKIGEMGCLESHLYCIKHAYNQGYEKILILEDDVYFDNHFLIKFREYASQLPPDWQCFFLGASQWSWWAHTPYLQRNLYPPVRGTAGTFALAIERSLMPDIINMMSAYDGPSDVGGYLKTIIRLHPKENSHTIAHIIDQRYPINHCFVFYPNLIIAETRNSDIRDAVSDKEYKDRCKTMIWKQKQKNIIRTQKINILENLNKFTNREQYKTIVVNDYDGPELYPDTLGKEFTLQFSVNTPFDVFTILSNSRNHQIIINGSCSDLIYYPIRMRNLSNVIFINESDK